MSDCRTFTAFVGARCVAAGELETVARAIAAEARPQGEVLLLDDLTGQPVDLDFRQGPAEAAAEYLRRARPSEQPPRQGRGRPRLGVVAREVTLLPRHWDWLASQPGGASAALRRLVEAARRSPGSEDRVRSATDAAYRAMSALGGDAPDFEEAARALFAGDDGRFDEIVAGWPSDVAAYVHRLVQAVRAARSPP